MNAKLRLFTLVALMMTTPLVFAQDEKEEKPIGWINTMVGGLNFTQSSFSNWAQGGENNWTSQLDINGAAEYNQEKYNWLNTLKIQYGVQEVEDIGNRKTVDEIRLESVGTYKISKYVNPYASFRAESQFSPGFEYSEDGTGLRVSKAFNPLKLTESFGVGYQPTDNFKTRLGLAFKQTLTGEDRFALIYTDSDPSDGIDRTLSEFGFESITDYQRKVLDNVLFVTKLELFSTFNDIDIEGVSLVDQIDVRWDNTLSSQISKYLAVSFNAQMLYDRNVSAKRQLKQVLAAGLTYTFF